MQIAEFYEDPLFAQLNIFQVQHRYVYSSKTNVQILTFSSHSLIFASDLQFPVSESVVYRVCFKINHSTLELFGHITSMIQSDYGSSSLYEYTYIMNHRNESNRHYLLAYRKKFLEKYQLSLEMNQSVKELKK